MRFGPSHDFKWLNSLLHHDQTMSYAREEFPLKRYNGSQSNIGCQIYTIFIDFSCAPLYPRYVQSICLRQMNIHLSRM